MGLMSKLKHKMEEKAEEFGLNPSTVASSSSTPPPPVPLSTKPPLNAPPVPSRPLGFNTQSTTPELPPRPFAPSGEPDDYTDEQEVLLDDQDAVEIWHNVPADKIVVQPDGRPDPYGGQVTGHEKHLYPTVTMPGSEGGKALGLYYPEWKIYRGFKPSDMPLQTTTHVYYAFALPTATREIKFTDEHAATSKDCGGTKGCANAMADIKAANPHLKVILSLGGQASSCHFEALATTRKKARAFATYVRKFIDQYGFDGVDLDWEHPHTPEDGENYLRLLTALRRMLPRPRYELTTALPVGQWVLGNINMKAAARVLDYFNLMCYDFAGNWSKKSAHHAQLFNRTDDAPGIPCGDKGVKYLLEQGFPAGKIILGVPAYARYFPKATTIAQSFDNDTSNSYENKEIPYKWVENCEVDKATAAAWYVCPEKGFASFDTAETVAVKAAYINDKGLGGMFFWHGAGDGDGAACLISSAFQGLR